MSDDRNKDGKNLFPDPHRLTMKHIALRDRNPFSHACDEFADRFEHRRRIVTKRAVAAILK